MANVSLTRANQKLAQARVMFEHVDKGTLTALHLQSLKEAVAFHLVCAYTHYLREIAETYGLKNSANITTELDLIAAFQAAKKYPSEAEELIALRKNNSSWLAQLHAYYDSLWVLPRTISTALETQDNENLINVVTLESSIDLLQVDVPLVEAWHSEFVALVMRQRETSAEF